jgi:hypothetical protein
MVCCSVINSDAKRAAIIKKYVDGMYTLVQRHPQLRTIYREASDHCLTLLNMIDQTSPVALLYRLDQLITIALRLSPHPTPPKKPYTRPTPGGAFNGLKGARSGEHRARKEARIFQPFPATEYASRGGRTASPRYSNFLPNGAVGGVGPATPQLPFHRVAAVPAGAGGGGGGGVGVGDAAVAVGVNLVAALDAPPRRPQRHGTC